MAAAVLLIALLPFASRFVDRKPQGLRVTVTGGPAVVGSPAPDFSSQTLDGAAIRLSQLRGKPVLLNFWATWCTACEVEMPEIQRASERYISRGMTMLAVNYHQTNTGDMRAFLKRVGARFPGVYDPDGRIATAYGVAIGLPVSIFIDRSGRVAFIQVGQMSGALLDARVQPIL